MKTLYLAPALFLFTLMALPVAAAETNPEPELLGLMFHADTCGSCKILDPKLQEARKNLSDQPVLFVTFDHSSPATREQAKMLAGALGVSDLYTAQKKASGFLLVVKADSKKVSASSKATKAPTTSSVCSATRWPQTKRRSPTLSTPEPLRDWLQSAYRYALSLTAHPHDAEDLVQEACVRCQRRYGRIPSRAVLCAAVRNLRTDAWRRGKSISFQPLVEDVADSTPVPSQLSAPEMATCLGRLGEAEREALYLNVVEGRTAREIGEFTKTSRNTVLSHLHRAKQKLRKMIREQEAADGSD